MFFQSSSLRSGALRAPVRALVGIPALLFTLLASCVDGPTGLGAEEPEITGIQLNLSQIELASGDTARFQAVLLGAGGKILPPSAGSPKAGPPIAWTSSDPGTVAVSRSGLVQAKKNGDVEISAVSGNIRASSTVKVRGNAKGVIVSPKVDTLSTLGATLQLTATVLGPNGQPVDNANVAWSSSDEDVATVSDAGKVAAIAAGVVMIVATARGNADTASIAVVPGATTPAVATISISPSTLQLEPGDEEKLAARAFTSGGSEVDGLSFAWSSSNKDIALVDDAGMVTATGKGKATITASTAGVKGTATVEVLDVAGPPPNAPGTTAELPRVFIDTRYKEPSGNVIRVRAGGDLQAALNSAKRGDIIELEAGATFTGNFTLPAKSGSGWIVIRSSGNLPPEGTRVTPANRGQMAKLVSTRGDGRVIATEVGASHYRLIGLEMTYASSVSQANAVVFLSTGTSHIVIDRSYIHGHPKLNLQRCVVLHAEYGAVIDSYLSECHFNGQDSQAIAAWNTNGPLKIVNNHLEGAGENVMFGGATSSENVVPSDIEIRGNYFYKPASWRNADGSSKWTVKNLFEIKSAQRVLLEGNVFDGNWRDGQDGMAFNLKRNTQSGRNPWNVCQDVTIRNNWIRNVDGGIKASTTLRLVIENNVFENLRAFGSNGRLFQLMSGLEDVRIENNTGFGTYSIITASGSEQKRFVMRNNIVTRGSYGINGSSGSEGTSTLSAHMPGYVFGGNVLIEARSDRYPSGNSFPSDLTEVRFRNPSSGDYGLQSTSPFRGKGTDGKDPGADMPVLQTVLSRSIQ